MTESEFTQLFTVLVADDNPESLEVVCTILTGAGYAVRVALDGAQVMEILEEQAVDLALLDVHMPKLDGYEVCRQMKASPDLTNIPVVFLSALNDPFNRVKGFDVGASDFVSKPCHAEELLARVVVHLKIRDLRLELEKRNLDLENRNRLLHEHEQSRELFTHMLVHDLRGPLQAVVSCLELLKDDNSLSSDSVALIADAQLGCLSVCRIVASILDVAQFEAGKLTLVAKPVDFKLCVESAIQSLSGLATMRKTQCLQEGELPVVACDRPLIDRVLVNLLGNAYKYGSAGTPVDILLSSDKQWLYVSVRNSGPGIPEPQRGRVFEKFSVLNTEPVGGHRSTGLGLAFCKMAIEAHGGSIKVDSDANQRTILSFTLPLTPYP